MLEGVLKRTKSAKKRAECEAELALPPFPMPLLYVWKAFQRLDRRRGSNGFSHNPISWPEIDAFVRNSKVDLRPWEISLIEDLDDLYRSEMAQAAKANSAKD